METNGRISKYRDRLDKTLASPDLTNADLLKSLIKTHLLNTTLNGVEECSEGLLERRTSQVSNFLDMLRSASVKTNGPKDVEKSHAEWKLKQDNEEFRVMYREGPPGSPFHTLLVEGYIDGPIDACLCVSWESSLYRKWWPHYHVPAFKVVSSKCLHKIRIGDQISLIRFHNKMLICSIPVPEERVKVAWPLSTREALLQYFEFEYFQDDLIIVLLNTIDESESIDRSTHGYTREMIPEAKDVVRIGLVGGFALQKVTENRSYFRTIANMDLKLDLVPPFLINFISRQLIGSGFRLYQKAIATVFNSDEEFKKAVGDPLYARIRNSLYQTGEQNLKIEDQPNDDLEAIEEHTEEMSEEVRTLEDVQGGAEEINQDIDMDQNDGGTASHGMETRNSTTNVCEIEEEGDEDGTREEERSDDVNKKRGVYISPEVEEALGTLEKVITMVREYGWNARNTSLSSSSDGDSEHQEEAGVEESVLPGGGESSEDRAAAAATEVSNKESTERCSEEPRGNFSNHSLRTKKSNSLREVNHNKVAPASPMESLMAPSHIDQATLRSSEKGKTEEPHPVLNDPIIIGDEIKENAAMDGGKKPGNRRKRYRLWCFHPGPKNSMA